MRRITTPPYCHWQTIWPVKHRKYNEKWKLVTVNEVFASDSWWPARDLKELLTASKRDNKSHGWSTNVSRGTVAGVKVKRVPSDTFPTDNFTAAELNPPPGYRYWQVVPEKKIVRLLCSFASDIPKSRKLRKLFEQHPYYVPPIEVPLPDGWIVDDRLNGWIEGVPDPKIANPQEMLQRSLDGNLNWEVESAFFRESLEDLVRLVFKRKSSGDAECWAVAGQTFDDDSPNALYRLLHYFTERKKPFKIDDFYKAHLLRLHHPTIACFLDVGFWKCWLEVRLYVDKTLCKQLKPASPIRAGAPGSQSDEVEAPAETLDWYRLFVRLLGTKTAVYSGNNFVV